MRTTAFALLSVVGAAAAQGVTEQIAPTAPSPPGCTGSFNGTFEVQVRAAVSKRDPPVETKGGKRQTTQCSGEGILVAALSDGVLTDAHQRTGYIASNYQFQFDDPPQAGAIYTAGFAVCENGALALGGSTQWWACVSGTFYNLYDRDWAPQCTLVEIDVLPCSGGGGSSDGSSSMVSGVGEGKELDWGSASAEATPAPASSARMCQIADGQVQHHETECPAPESTAAPQGVTVSQISDGQIQASAASQSMMSSEAPVSQSSEAPVSQSSDGQIEATPWASAAPEGTVSVAPVSQISDGQIQATQEASAAPEGTGSVAPVSQISDGQIQASQLASAAAPEGTSSIAPVSESSEGQVEATTIVTAQPQPSSETQASETQAASSEAQGPEETNKPEGGGWKTEGPGEGPKGGSGGSGAAGGGAPGVSAAPGGVAQTNAAASSFSVNWGSRAVTASVTPAWLGGPGAGGRAGALTGGRLAGAAAERYRFGSAYASAAGILGMMFWVF